MYAGGWRDPAGNDEGAAGCELIAKQLENRSNIFTCPEFIERQYDIVAALRLFAALMDLVPGFAQ